jgi:urea transport system permease protein
MIKKIIFRAINIQRSIIMLLIICSGAVQAESDEFAEKAAVLSEGSFRDKIAAVGELSRIDHPRVQLLLHALLEGLLYERDGVLVIASDADDGYALQDALTGADLGIAGTRDVKKVRINNSLRTTLKETLAFLNVSAADKSIRIAAIEQLIGTLDKSSAETLRLRLEKEQDDEVLSLIRSACAIVDLGSPDKEIVSTAIAELRGNTHPQVRAALGKTVSVYAETELGGQARSALNSIQSKLDFYAFLETLFFGLSLGSILALAAIGLAITFGVMGVINMAHGELIMLGAYTTYAIQMLLPNHIEISLLLAVPLAFLVSGSVGILIERGVIRFLYGRPLETLLATFGISLILQQTVRTFVSAQNVAVITPQWLSGSWQINNVLSLTYNRLYIFIFALFVFAALFVLLKYTSLGLQLRAVSQNRAMAKAVGIRSEWVDAMTFGLGSGIAGIAGVALSQLTNVGPNLGQGYIIDSFMVVVFGGVGNLMGTLVGGLTLGIANKFIEPVSGAVLAKILVLVFIILFIQKRPRGLFPQKGRAADN